ncbi:adenosylcobinamide-GDP ribazoletransferase [Nocardia panacis]|uniref:Adenosylcobinamide-GDP ribazoletransferase n=1 Tax=Nocardia panacis TaxID=2340916 RepID=A0A3A4KIU3_9NOCA|nr:adenosylcobinamide-GDP ribazoletransferase [Nocardia panacis]RJO69073.1 adenosylcobinamide-GDP ribazoletransferase [Nocardia panacis]
MNGARLALSWLTVLPVRGPRTVDRAMAGRAIALAPFVGILLGGAAAGVVWGLSQAGAGTLLAGLLAVGALGMLTRGMHLDGLADTADGLGVYGPPERAREIMKSGGAGPFGVAAIVFAIGIQAVSFARLAEEGRWAAIGLAVAAGRVAVVFACRHGIEAAPGAGFGALVAGTQRISTGAAWGLLAIVGGYFVGPHHYWVGPIAVTVVLVMTSIVVAHCVRRFGGLSGDVLGAAVEVATAFTAVGCALG